MSRVSDDEEKPCKVTNPPHYRHNDILAPNLGEMVEGSSPEMTSECCTICETNFTYEEWIDRARCAWCREWIHSDTCGTWLNAAAKSELEAPVYNCVMCQSRGVALRRSKRLASGSREADN